MAQYRQNDLLDQQMSIQQHKQDLQLRIKVLQEQKQQNDQQYYRSQIQFNNFTPVKVKSDILPIQQKTQQNIHITNKKELSLFNNLQNKIDLNLTPTQSQIRSAQQQLQLLKSKMNGVKVDINYEELQKERNDVQNDLYLIQQNSKKQNNNNSFDYNDFQKNKKQQQIFSNQNNNSDDFKDFQTNRKRMIQESIKNKNDYKENQTNRKKLEIQSNEKQLFQEQENVKGKNKTLNDKKIKQEIQNNQYQNFNEQENVKDKNKTLNEKKIQQLSNYIPQEKKQDNSSQQKDKNQVQDQQNRNYQIFDNLEDEQIQENLYECTEGCGRSFTQKALYRHAKICAKVFQEKRKQFDTKNQRIVDDLQVVIEHQKNQKTQKKQLQQQSQETQSKGQKWKQQSQAFRAMISQNKGVKMSLEVLFQQFKQEKQIQAIMQEAQGLQQCQSCNRKFNQNALARHEPYCIQKSQKLKF